MEQQTPAPIQKSQKRPGGEAYTVQNILCQNGVVMLNLAPIEGKPFTFKSGQFAMISLFNADGSVWKTRPFSICSSPTDKDHLEFTIKIYGEFTHAIANLKRGDRVGVSGPYGVFVFKEEEMKSVVFLAGGIGVAPFMSMIRYATAKRLPNELTLLYSMKTGNDLVFVDELKALAEENEKLRVIFTVTENIPDAWSHERGMIDETMLNRHCSSFAGTHFLLCGPPGFMDAMKQCLAKRGVPKDRILFEAFS